MSPWVSVIVLLSNYVQDDVFVKALWLFCSWGLLLGEVIMYKNPVSVKALWFFFFFLIILRKKIIKGKCKKSERNYFVSFYI